MNAMIPNLTMAYGVTTGSGLLQLVLPLMEAIPGTRWRPTTGR